MSVRAHFGRSCCTGSEEDLNDFRRARVQILRARGISGFVDNVTQANPSLCLKVKARRVLQYGIANQYLELEIVFVISSNVVNLDCSGRIGYDGICLRQSQSTRNTLLFAIIYKRTYDCKYLSKSLAVS